jgi:hypothetical protein
MHIPSSMLEGAVCPVEHATTPRCFFRLVINNQP